MRLRFSISNLLLLTAIVGLIFGWWLDRIRLKEDKHEMYITAQEAIYDAGHLAMEAQGIIEAMPHNQFYYTATDKLKKQIDLMGDALRKMETQAK